jgi:uncharacterized DUF497 family protein
MNFAEMMGIPDWEFRLVFGRTRIDYDPEKEEANRRKHHISLESAVTLLERLLISPLGRNRHPFATSDGFLENGEVRHMHLCVDDDHKVLLIVTTMRDEEVIRAISVRRASAEERAQFTELTGYVEPLELRAFNRPTRIRLS